MPLTVDEQLAAAASRILNDGLQHADAAIGWAIDFLREQYPDTPHRPVRDEQWGFAAW